MPDRFSINSSIELLIEAETEDQAVAKASNYLAAGERPNMWPSGITSSLWIHQVKNLDEVVDDDDED